jgi:hypothetical protein
VKKRIRSQGFRRLEPAVRAGRTAVRSVANVHDILSILAAISSYELQFRCSSACWTRMDEDFNTMILDLDFEMIKN